MTDNNSSQVEGFHRFLISAVRQIRTLTARGTLEVLDDICRLGAVPAAKKRLQSQHSDLYEACKRVDRLDLSIEALALDPKWATLFAADELAQARLRLTPNSAGLALACATNNDSEDRLLPAALGSEAVLTWTVGARRVSFQPLDFFVEESSCEIVGQHASSPTVHLDAFVRKHLRECPRCQDRHRELVETYERTDLEALDTWFKILDVFVGCLRPDLNEWVVVAPPLSLPNEPDATEVQFALDEIRSLCEWRALHVGVLLGQFMAAFGSSFGAIIDPWLGWRTGKITGTIGKFIQAIPRWKYTYALAARYLMLVRVWPRREEAFVWIPLDEDIDEGVVRIDDWVKVETAPIDEWEEILGVRPTEFNPGAVLFLAEETARALMQDIEPSANVESVASEQLEQLRHLEQLIRETNSKQDVEINSIDRIVALMKSADKYSCETELKEVLPGFWGRLARPVRRQLIGAEQIRRMPGGHVTPEKVLHGIATAFELQLKHTVLETLLTHLRSVGIKDIPEGASDRDLVFRWYWKADKYTLGSVKRLFASAHPAIKDCFERYHWDRNAILEAVETVAEHRNPAAHGREMDSYTVDAIREDWFNWRGRQGGLFSVLFVRDYEYSIRVCDEGHS